MSETLKTRTFLSVREEWAGRYIGVELLSDEKIWVELNRSFGGCDNKWGCYHKLLNHNIISTYRHEYYSCLYERVRNLKWTFFELEENIFTFFRPLDFVYFITITFSGPFSVIFFTVISISSEFLNINSSLWTLLVQRSTTDRLLHFQNFLC